MSVVGLRIWVFNNGRKLHQESLLTTLAWIPSLFLTDTISYRLVMLHIHTCAVTYIWTPQHTLQMIFCGNISTDSSVYESWKLTRFWSQVPSQKRYPVISKLVLCLLTKPDFRQKFKLPLHTETPSNSFAHSPFQLCQAVSGLQTSPILPMSSPASRFNQTLL